MENISSSNEQTYLEADLAVQEKNAPKKRLLPPKFFWYASAAILALFFLSVFLLSAPSDFPAGTIFRVGPGDSLRSVSLKLKDEHIIRSRTIFEAFVILFGKEKHIISTDYYFEGSVPVYEVARRISKGEHHMAPISVTIPEGFDVAQIADTFSSELLNFNKERFLEKAADKEGYLFPDTYFFLNIDNDEDVLKSMTDNFEKKVAPLRDDILATGKSEKDIIVMASIVEREAKGDADREFISGILWHRIAIGMPLQVDAAPDTYKTKGLPKNPIANPGILAIKAALHPQKSDYLYYLHDKNGIIHYAKTFAEHVQNKSKYLK